MVALLPAEFSESFKNLSDVVLIIDRTRRSNRNQRTLIVLYGNLASFTESFSCPDNERLNLKSRRLVVVFRAKANLLALAIFKQRISDFWLVLYNVM